MKIEKQAEIDELVKTTGIDDRAKIWDARILALTLD